MPTFSRRDACLRATTNPPPLPGARPLLSAGQCKLRRPASGPAFCVFQPFSGCLPFSKRGRPADARCACIVSLHLQLRNYRAIARARRRRLLLRRRRGSRLGGRVSNGPCFRAKAAVVRGGTRLRLSWVERVDLARKPPRLRSFSSTCETWPERSRRARPEFSNLNRES
jgi:hypothetical protein